MPAFTPYTFFYFLLSSTWSHSCIYGSWRFCLSLCISQLSFRIVLCDSLPSWLYALFSILFTLISNTFPLIATSSLSHPYSFLFSVTAAFHRADHLRNLWAPAALQPSPATYSPFLFHFNPIFKPTLTHSTSLSILLLLKPQCAPFCPRMFILQLWLKSKGPPRLTG